MLPPTISLARPAVPVAGACRPAAARRPSLAARATKKGGGGAAKKAGPSDGEERGGGGLFLCQNGASESKLGLGAGQLGDAKGVG